MWVGLCEGEGEINIKEVCEEIINERERGRERESYAC